MTTEVLPNYAALAHDLPVSRFMKWFKPDYTILAAKFTAGVMTGVALGLCAGVPGYGVAVEAFGSLTFPSLSDSAVDRCVTNNPAGGGDIPQERMDGLSTVASYGGSLIGSTVTLLARHEPMLALNVGMVIGNTVLGATIDWIGKAGRPTRGSGPELS